MLYVESKLVYLRMKKSHDVIEKINSNLINIKN